MRARRDRRDRGTALLHVLILMMLALSVVTLLLMATSTLTKQGRVNRETTSVRNEARGGVHAASAFLNDRLGSTSARPPGAEWAGDGSAANPYYLVLVGKGASCEIDPSGDNYVPGVAGGWSAGDLGVTSTVWLNEANDLLRDPPAGFPYTRLTRVEYREVGADWYYHVWTVAMTDAPGVRDPVAPTVLVAQAALVPEAPMPFRYGFAGRAAVRVDGTGTLGTANPADGNSDPVLASNGAITR